MAASGTVVLTTTCKANRTIYSWAYTTDTNVAEAGAPYIPVITGYPVQFVHKWTDTDAATDITMVDDEGVDILMGVGTNVPASASSTGNYRAPLNTDGAYNYLNGKTITFKVANAVGAQSGVAELHVKDRL